MAEVDEQPREIAACTLLVRPLSARGVHAHVAHFGRVAVVVQEAVELQGHEALYQLLLAQRLQLLVNGRQIGFQFLRRQIHAQHPLGLVKHLFAAYFLAARQLFQLERLMYHFLYFLDARLLADGNQRDGNARGGRAARAAAAVRVLFHIVGQVVVEYVRQVIDVQTARRHIGGHQQLQVLEAEAAHGVVALGLRQVAVQGVGVVAVAYEFFGHLLRLAPGAAENNRINLRIVVDNPLQGQITFLGLHHVVVVRHVGRTFVAAAYRHFNRFLHVAARHGADFIGHRGRKQPRVLFFGRIG